MKLLPFDKFTLETHLSPEQVIVLINDNTDNSPMNFFTTGDNNEMFSGHAFGDNTFTIHLTDYRNIPRFTIGGSIIQAANGSEIKARVRLSMILMICYGIVICALIIFAIIITADMINTHQFEKPAIGVYVCLAFTYLIMITEFNTYNTRAKQMLAYLFEKESDKV